MFQRTCSGSLYTTLEVSRDATPQEIKKAYHKMAFRFHPDKTGGTTTEQFQLIKDAQSILSDPNQRRVYDTFGRMGVDSIRQFGDVSVPLTPAAIRKAMFFAAFWMSLLLLTVVLIIVRLDYNKSWPWAVVFVPLWVALIPLFLIGGVLLFYGTTRREIATVLLGTEFLLFIASVVMLVVGLSGALAWHLALAPGAGLYVLQSFYVLSFMFSSQFCNRFDEAMDPETSICWSRMYWGFFLVTAFEKVCGFSFVTLALLRATQSGDKVGGKLLSFWLVFAPLIVYFGCMAFVASVRRFMAKSEEEPSGIPYRLCQALAAAMGYGTPLFMVCMLAAKCEAEQNHVSGGLHPSAALVLFPLLSILAFAVLLPSCMFCYVELLFGGLSRVETTEDGESSTLQGDNVFGRANFMYNAMPNYHTNDDGGGGQAAESPRMCRDARATDTTYIRTTYHEI
ncbi:heat shock protein [Trypanosoma rangeli]|uniref:Heat shock protein n=1 Tax=Trypanosoma rangeli TaxID=5698 RepID=A0A3R7M9P3_TRYRA|nr:heat shock protein [Trypanosoma rangeli]RNF01961.1 heat shock protein [Trypanosoma rangeli]|eukprot:RNF01961.1 heat shock protein [Trypanosoma rangeli]